MPSKRLRVLDMRSRERPENLVELSSCPRACFLCLLLPVCLMFRSWSSSLACASCGQWHMWLTTARAHAGKRVNKSSRFGWAPQKRAVTAGPQLTVASLSILRPSAFQEKSSTEQVRDTYLWNQLLQRLRCSSEHSRFLNISSIM